MRNVLLESFKMMCIFIESYILSATVRKVL